MSKLTKTKKTFSIIGIFTVLFFCTGLIFLGVSFQTTTQINDTAIIKPITAPLTKTPKVTVLMSTYNRADLLPNAIESILNQTFKDFEFIIINDGSTDNTDEILKSYAQKDNRIIIKKNKKNKGLIYSLNQGLDMARGEYIARMDDDDWSVLDRLKIQATYLDDNPDITVLGSGYCKLEKGTCGPGGPQNVEQAKIISYIRVPVMHPTTMFRRTFLNKHNIRYNSKYPSSEDTDFFHQIASKGGKITNIPTPLILYTQTSKKIPGYYKQQALSHRAFVHDTLSPYMDENKLVPNSHGFCYILIHLEKAAAEGRLNLHVPTIRQMIINSNCKTE